MGCSQSKAPEAEAPERIARARVRLANEELVKMGCPRYNAAENEVVIVMMGNWELIITYRYWDVSISRMDMTTGKALSIQLDGCIQERDWSADAQIAGAMSFKISLQSTQRLQAMRDDSRYKITVSMQRSRRGEAIELRTELDVSAAPIAEKAAPPVQPSVEATRSIEIEPPDVIPRRSFPTSGTSMILQQPPSQCCTPSTSATDEPHRSQQQQYLDGKISLPELMLSLGFQMRPLDFSAHDEMAPAQMCRSSPRLAEFMFKLTQEVAENPAWCGSVMEALTVAWQRRRLVLQAWMVLAADPQVISHQDLKSCIKFVSELVIGKLPSLVDQSWENHAAFRPLEEAKYLQLLEILCNMDATDIHSVRAEFKETFMGALIAKKGAARRMVASSEAMTAIAFFVGNLYANQSFAFDRHYKAGLLSTFSKVLEVADQNANDLRAIGAIAAHLLTVGEASPLDWDDYDDVLALCKACGAKELPSRDTVQFWCTAGSCHDELKKWANGIMTTKDFQQRLRDHKATTNASAASLMPSRPIIEIVT